MCPIIGVLPAGDIQVPSQHSSGDAERCAEWLCVPVAVPQFPLTVHPRCTMLNGNCSISSDGFAGLVFSFQLEEEMWSLLLFVLRIFQAGDQYPGSHLCALSELGGAAKTSAFSL